MPLILLRFGFSLRNWFLIFSDEWVSGVSDDFSSYLSVCLHISLSDVGQIRDLPNFSFSGCRVRNEE